MWSKNPKLHTHSLSRFLPLFLLSPLPWHSNNNNTISSRHKPPLEQPWSPVLLPKISPSTLALLSLDYSNLSLLSHGLKRQRKTALLPPPQPPIAAPSTAISHLLAAQIFPPRCLSLQLATLSLFLFDSAKKDSQRNSRKHHNSATILPRSRVPLLSPLALV